MHLMHFSELKKRIRCVLLCIMTFKAKKIANIMDIKTGFPLRKAAKEQHDGNAFLVQMKDLDPVEGMRWEQVIKINTEHHRSISYLKSGDVLFVGRGSRFFAVQYEADHQNYLASPHLYVLRSKDVDEVLPGFVAWFLNSRASQKFFSSNQEGSALPYISRKTLSTLPVPLPDLETQKNIASTYNCWRRQKKLMENLIENKDLYINRLLENKLTGDVA